MKNISIVGEVCCGCTACEQLCPKNSIHFQENEEGFWYPAVDQNTCIHCGRCLEHCPVMQSAASHREPIVYAAKCKASEIARSSTSGGIFVLLARKILEEQGVVVGCAFDEKLTARHILIEQENELYKLQGSKYVQSDLSGVYSRIKDELIKGRKVLFSGTGCQAAGLRTFLGKDFENLFLVDLVCHGVPSPKLFRKYMEYLEKQFGEPIKNYHFRSKHCCGWGLFYRFEMSTKSKTGSGWDDPYYHAFLQQKNYRESCYVCRFTDRRRMSDITLGDFWGIESMIPSFYSKNGVSLVLIHTEKGKQLWEQILQEVEAIEASMEQAVRKNRNLLEPSPRPSCRDTIYQGINGDFADYVKKNLPVQHDVKRKLKSLISVSVKGKIKYRLKKE